MAAFIATIR
ncbi:hypothetical protein YPPY32_4972, partial [Yersinia pestis PY-32]